MQNQVDFGWKYFITLYLRLFIVPLVLLISLHTSKIKCRICLISRTSNVCVKKLLNSVSTQTFPCRHGMYSGRHYLCHSVPVLDVYI